MWGQVLGDRDRLSQDEGESLHLALGTCIVQAGCKDVQVLIHHELLTYLREQVHLGVVFKQ